MKKQNFPIPNSTRIKNYTGGLVDVDLSTDVLHVVTVTGNSEISFINPRSGIFEFYVYVIQSNGGGWSLDWSGDVDFGGEVPMPTIADGTSELYKFLSIDGGAAFIARKVWDSESTFGGLVEYQEFRGSRFSTYDLGYVTSGAVEVIHEYASYQKVELGGDVSFNIKANTPPGKYASMRLSVYAGDGHTVTWPANVDWGVGGDPTLSADWTEIEFSWSTKLTVEGTDRSVNIVSATQADPVVIVTGTDHGYGDGDEVFIANVAGMTQLNNKFYRITYISDTSFSLNQVDGSAYSAYTSGGTVQPRIRGREV